MVAKRWRMMSAPVLGTAALMMTPLLMNCGGMPGMPGLPGGCPADLNDPSAIMQANFGMKGELEGKVKAALSAGATLKNLAAEVEGDVSLACGNLAKDLGASEDDIKPAEEGPGKKAEAACNAAVKLLGQVKAKAKISGKLNVKVVPPKCSASMDAMASCAGECSADVKGPEAKVECEGGEISGTCDAECKGSCTVEAGAKCEGTCSGSCEGSCEAEFSGKCDGACEGKCDGQASTAGKNGGKCAGTCEGKCEAGAKGKCGGKCGGKCSASCEVKGQAKCEGTCSGGCSVEMKAPKCSGTVKPPEMSAECKANCDAKVNAKVECTPASVTLEASGAADAEAFAKLKGAIEKNLPGILKVTLGMKARLEGAVAQVKASIEGVKAAVSGGGSAALKIAGCFAASLKAQAEASVSINVSVKASASASGSAGAG